MNARSQSSLLLLGALFIASANQSFADCSSQYNASEDPLYHYQAATPAFGAPEAQVAALPQPLTGELKTDSLHNEIADEELLDLPELLSNNTQSHCNILAKTHLAFDHGFTTIVPKEEPVLEFPKMHIAYRLSF